MAGRDTILCVDDEEGVLAVLEEQLRRRFGGECGIETAASAGSALELMDELARDGDELAVVIADQMMPGMVGSELLEEVERRSPHTMKLLLTGQAGMDAVVAAINRARLNYYLAKPWDEAALLLAVENFLRQFRLARENRGLVEMLRTKNQALVALNRELEARVDERTHELQQANERLSQLAVTDGLTGLYNYRHFQERLTLEVERSGRNGMPLSLLMVDVDHFKQYNDDFGHPCGDEALQQVARLLAHERRANDVVARYGGEEFAVLLVETPKAVAMTLAARLVVQAAEMPPPRGMATSSVAPRQLTISVGVACMPDDAKRPLELLRAADAALYTAKRGGRNRAYAAGEQP